MSADHVFEDTITFAKHLRELRAARSSRVDKGRTQRPMRAVLTPAERSEILNKTGGRCHICGGAIRGNDWQADHVLAYSTGGPHDVVNYLAAHSLCNNYRWNYDPEEFQWILKLGVWLRTQIERETSAGLQVGAQFVSHERRRAGRRQANRGPKGGLVEFLSTNRTVKK